MFDGASDLSGWRGNWLHRLIARPGFQSWAARFPMTRPFTRKDGQELFELVQGFVQSQALLALVELQILERLRAGPATPGDLGLACGVAPERMQILLQAGAAMKLLRRRGARYGLARKGAALLGVPGLRTMIRHHRAFYRDLEDPVALLRGPEQTELSRFWPYVIGARGGIDPGTAQTYSDLMAQSQGLVAEDTLRQISLRGVTRLMDVGGGTGAFLGAVARRYPRLRLTLFDLPDVIATAPARLEKVGLQDRVDCAAGSFRDDPLPSGADAISLIRVLYDHSDETVRALLAKVHDALPPGGRLIISESMSGGHRPERSGDIYFAFYTMAMQTGRTRSAAEIRALCSEAGFTRIRSPRPLRPFVTSVLTAVKPG